MSASPKVWSRTIVEDNEIVDRTLRGWITAGKFPPPDGNLNGRNFWHLHTYQQWKADVLAGKFAMRRRPCAAVSEADTAASSAPPEAA